MRAVTLIIISFLLASCSSISDVSKTQVSFTDEIENLNQINKYIDALKDKNVLLVLDIDDTILTSHEFFGSDKWYDWQKGRGVDSLGKKIPITENQKVMCLFDVLGITFEISANKPTQSDAVKIINQISTDIVVLTARNELYRTATRRELDENGFDFIDNHLALEGLPLRFKVNHNDRFAVVSYIDGVYMVAGMDKGVMLRILLNKLNKSYDAIVFVDDKEKNIVNMKNAMLEDDVDFYGLRYTKIDKSIAPHELESGVKAAVKLSDYVKNYFPERAKRFNKGECSY